MLWWQLWQNNFWYFKSINLIRVLASGDGSFKLVYSTTPEPTQARWKVRQLGVSSKAFLMAKILSRSVRSWSEISCRVKILTTIKV